MITVLQCQVDTCDAPRLHRDWCGKHYQRWRKHGDPTHAARRTYPIVTCSVDGCEVQAKARGWCNLHYLRWKRHGDPTHVDPPHLPPAMRGADNPKWKGDQAKYSAVHNRIHRLLGLARNRTCTNCAAQAEDWAYDHADPNELIDAETGFPYSTDPARYVPLCKPCHWRLDRPGKTAVTRAAEQAVIVPSLNGVITT